MINKSYGLWSIKHFVAFWFVSSFLKRIRIHVCELGFTFSRWISSWSCCISFSWLCFISLRTDSCFSICFLSNSSFICLSSSADFSLGTCTNKLSLSDSDTFESFSMTSLWFSCSFCQTKIDLFPVSYFSDIWNKASHILTTTTLQIHSISLSTFSTLLYVKVS